MKKAVIFPKGIDYLTIVNIPCRVPVVVGGDHFKVIGYADLTKDNESGKIWADLELHDKCLIIDYVQLGASVKINKIEGDQIKDAKILSVILIP